MGRCSFGGGSFAAVGKNEPANIHTNANTRTDIHMLYLCSCMVRIAVGKKKKKKRKKDANSIFIIISYKQKLTDFKGQESVYDLRGSIGRRWQKLNVISIVITLLFQN